MIPITIRQLQYFVAVYEEASFSKAAEREHCSQPALSSQIRNLETILARSLFDRSVSGATPTASGQRFYRHSVAILRSVNTARLEMDEVSGQVAGQVKAGLIPSVMRGLMPIFLPTFVETYPMIDIRIVQGFSDMLAESVISETVDFAFVLEPPKHEGIEITKLAEGSMVLISSSGLGLKCGEPVRLPDLAPINLVVPSPNHTMRRNIERRIWTKEIHVSRVLEMDSVHGMIDFVANSKWATILPLMSVAHDIKSDGLCINPIVEPYLEADVYLINLMQRPLRATAQVFVQAIQRELESISKVDMQ
ncbi:MAG: LysR family transcriptional regulator [Rhodocyclaceae bacterium]|jgi:DNA-binding transcriptional LysR family regulator|nr:LysR family transcriptional regulator [Rhodocyclaceae bacterium]